MPHELVDHRPQHRPTVRRPATELAPLAQHHLPRRNALAPARPHPTNAREAPSSALVRARTGSTTQPQGIACRTTVEPWRSREQRADRSSCLQSEGAGHASSRGTSRGVALARPIGTDKGEAVTARPRRMARERLPWPRIAVSGSGSARVRFTCIACAPATSARGARSETLLLLGTSTGKVHVYRGGACGSDAQFRLDRILQPGDELAAPIDVVRYDVRADLCAAAGSDGIVCAFDARLRPGAGSAGPPRVFLRSTRHAGSRVRDAQWLRLPPAAAAPKAKGRAPMRLGLVTGDALGRVVLHALNADSKGVRADPDSHTHHGGMLPRQKHATNPAGAVALMEWRRSCSGCPSSVAAGRGRRAVVRARPGARPRHRHRDLRARLRRAHRRGIPSPPSPPLGPSGRHRRWV